MSFSSATTVFSDGTYGSSVIHSQHIYQQYLCSPPPSPPPSVLPSVLPYICNWTLIGPSDDVSVGQNWRLETTSGLDSWNLKGHNEGMSPISSWSHLEHNSTENLLRGLVPGTPSEGRETNSCIHTLAIRPQLPRGTLQPTWLPYSLEGYCLRSSCLRPAAA